MYKLWDYKTRQAVTLEQVKEAFQIPLEKYPEDRDVVAPQAIKDDKVVFGYTEVLVDLGAEQLLAAERDNKRIAVEIKSFLKPSLIQDLKEAIGQFILYSDALVDFPNEADRTLYPAIRVETLQRRIS